MTLLLIINNYVYYIMMSTNAVMSKFVKVKELKQKRQSISMFELILLK